jgi:hypothetical protein
MNRRRRQDTVEPIEQRLERERPRPAPSFVSSARPRIERRWLQAGRPAYWLVSALALLLAGIAVLIVALVVAVG